MGLKGSAASTAERSTAFPSLIPATKGNNEAFKWLESPEIHWKGRMVFDGRLVRMDGGVVDIKSRVQTDEETIWHVHGVGREIASGIGLTRLRLLGLPRQKQRLLRFD